MDTKQAAEALGITPDAVRKRVSRGLLESDKDQDGRLYIWLEDDTPPAHHESGRDELIEFLRSELALWQEEARRKDHIIAGLVNRVPELEAAPEPREAPVTASDNGNRAEPPPDTERRSWWRRLFEA